MLTLRIYLDKYWETQEDEFDLINFEKHFDTHPCNIYIVGSRPRVIIDPNYLDLKGNLVSLKFKVQEQYEFRECIGALTLNRSPIGNIKLESEYPYSRFILKDDIGFFFDKEQFSDNPDALLKAEYALRLSNIDADFKNLSDFKILYIGQSLKMDKKISPVIRVQNHKNIQRILRKCTTKYTDKEVYIIFCSFIHKIDLITEFENIIKLGGGTKLIEKIQSDISKLKADTKLITQIAEAALIDYFDTREFNSDFIGTFGRKTHSYYKSIKSSELERITVEIDLLTLSNIYSDKIQPKRHHGIEFLPKKDFERNVFHADEMVAKTT